MRNGADIGWNITEHENVLTSQWFLIAREIEEQNYEEKQMTALMKVSAGASPTSVNDWKAIDWQKAVTHVRLLQLRIAKAFREGKHGKVKSLQWILTHSFYAKILAIKRVVQNQGAKTPGIDGVVWKTPKQKMDAAISLKRRGYKTKPLKRDLAPKKRTPR